MARIYWTQKQDIGPAPRADHSMAFDSNRGRAVLFGGTDPISRLFNDTWEWDGQNWTQMANTGPAERLLFALAFDSQRKQTVLLGGAGSGAQGGVFSDTWGWDGESWTQLADSGPGPRSGHALAFDNDRQRTVLFDGALRGDTWEWDGEAWTQVADTGPPARKLHCMAYDSNRGRTVLFGGVDPSGTVIFGDTWEWDGAIWTQVADFGADPCVSAALAFKKDSVALFGGNNPTDPVRVFGNTWTWDGRHWTLRQDIGPGPRSQHAMAFDSGRERLVLFGGLLAVGSRGTIRDDTWEHFEVGVTPGDLPID
jgi:hypothetical protein